MTFLINGDGAARAELERAAAGLANVRFAGYVPDDRLAEVLATGDIHVVPLRRGLGAVSVPSKTYSILAAGRPVVAAIDPGTEVPRLLGRVRRRRRRAARRPGRVRRRGRAALARRPRAGAPRWAGAGGQWVDRRGVAGGGRRAPTSALVTELATAPATAGPAADPPVASRPRGFLIVDQEGRQAGPEGQGQEGPLPGRDAVPADRRWASWSLGLGTHRLRPRQPPGGRRLAADRSTTTGTSPTASTCATPEVSKLTGTLEETDSTGQLVSTDFLRTGVHSHDDGVIHWHPFTSAAAGDNATLGVFLDTTASSSTTTSCKFPAEPARRHGVRRGRDQVRDGEDGELTVAVWDNFTDTERRPTSTSPTSTTSAIDQNSMVIVDRVHARRGHRHRDAAVGRRAADARRGRQRTRRPRPLDTSPAPCADGPAHRRHGRRRHRSARRTADHGGDRHDDVARAPTTTGG